MSRRMPTHVRAAFEAELSAARRADTAEQRWTALERAHIISQRWPWPHTRAHAVMLQVAWREQDRREAAGQVIRLLVAAPGSALGATPRETPAAPPSPSPRRCPCRPTWPNS